MNHTHVCVRARMCVRVCVCMCVGVAGVSIERGRMLIKSTNTDYKMIGSYLVMLYFGLSSLSNPYLYFKY